MDYYIGPNGELYHGLFDKGKPRDDHKYIKREWKNGRWQYTYKTDTKSKSSSSSSSSSAGKRGAKGTVYINARENGKSGANLANAMSTYNTQIKKAAAFMKAYDRADAKKKHGPTTIEDDVKALTEKSSLISGADEALKKADAAKKQVGKLAGSKSENELAKKQVVDLTGSKSDDVKTAQSTDPEKTDLGGIKSWLEDRKADWAEAKARADKKAEEEAKADGLDLVNTDERGSSTWRMSGSYSMNYGNGSSSGSYESGTHYRGTDEQFIDTAVEYLKNRFGFGDSSKDLKNDASVDDAIKEGKSARKNYKSAQKEYDEAAGYFKSVKNAYDKIRDDAYADDVITSDEQKDIDKFKQEWERAARTANSKLSQLASAKEEYRKTNIGKAGKWLKDLFGVDDYLIDPISPAERAKTVTEERERGQKGSDIRSSMKKFKDDLLSKLKNPLEGLNLIVKYNTPDEDQAAVNPNYEGTYGSSGRSKWDENCALCTITYDLRRRGYDVEARNEDEVVGPDGERGLDISEIAKLYGLDDSDVGKMTDRYKHSGYAARDKNNISRSEVASELEKLEQTLATYGDGARGNFCVYWRQGGGHSVSWEVENGEVVIRDAQTNKTHTLDEYATDIYYFEYIRTDNVEPTDEIRRYVKNRGEK